MRCSVPRPTSSDHPTVKAVAAFRVPRTPGFGRHRYVDDLSTIEIMRRQAEPSKVLLSAATDLLEGVGKGPGGGVDHVTTGDLRDPLQVAGIGVAEANWECVHLADCRRP